MAPAIFDTVPVRLLALAAIAAPFVVSALTKLRDFAAAEREVAALGLGPAAPIAALVIALQLGGGVLLFLPGLTWIGTGLLGVFTLIATLAAHRWWRSVGEERIRQAAAFWEHAAISGGCLAVAILSARGAMP